MVVALPVEAEALPVEDLEVPAVEAWAPAAAVPEAHLAVAGLVAVRNFGRSMAFRFRGSDRDLFRVDFRRVTVSTCSRLTSRVLE